MHARTGSAFDLSDASAYRAWRERKLARFPRSLGELVVEVRDPRSLSAGERAALFECCERANMAIYASASGGDADKEIPRRLGAQLGLQRLDCNYLSDDGISPLADTAGAKRGEFIPYTNRSINWHTDGYYNADAATVRAMLLHCVERAEAGGENQLLDPEIVYIRLRDRDPQHVRALTARDAMTIPARVEDGRVARPAQAGPVFSLDAGGHLHMRYTARSVSIAWKDDGATRAALAALDQILASNSAETFRARLEPGMGLVSNNVLHTRSAFTDSPQHKRFVYRARYYERVCPG